MKALGISDHGTISGVPEHFRECKKAGIKPVGGVELYITHEPVAAKSRARTHMVCWAKNKQGWADLLRLTSQTNDPEYYYYRPRIELRDRKVGGKLYPGLETFTRSGNLQAFSGHQGSHLSDCLFADLYGDPEKRKADLRAAYGQYKDIKDPAFFKKFLRPDWLDAASRLALDLEDIFGKGNFWIELQNELNPNDKLALWVHPLIVDCLREVSRATGIPAVASSDPHYPTVADAVDQRLMVMINMRESEASIAAKLEAEGDADVLVFFGSDNFYLHSYEEMSKNFTAEELNLTNQIADGIEEYSIEAEAPYVPNFAIPDFNDRLSWLKDAPTQADKYLRYLCFTRGKSLIPWDNPAWRQKGLVVTSEDYRKRLDHELDVVYKAKIAPYFLAIWDICMAADNRPADHSFDWLANLNKGGKVDPVPRGPGRGSAAGCLISYMIGITKIDSLLYNLSFARFFNFGRVSKGRIEMPDIDVDFAAKDRDWVLSYIVHKYGSANVAQMVTLARMQGKASVKDVFRVKSIDGGFDLVNEICKHIPDEAEIADELQVHHETGDEDYGVLSWALENSIDIQEYYQRADLKPVFDQAIRCEGTKRGQSKHASGVVVTPVPCETIFPMVLDPKTKQKIVGVDMNDVAKLGGIKLDILGVSVLDKLKLAQDLINHVPQQR